MAEFNYILFTHLPVKHKPADDRAWRAFNDNAEVLGRILNPNGMLVMFLDLGWPSLLNTIGIDFDPVTLAQEFGKIVEFERGVEDLKKTAPTLTERLRLVTAKTLSPILNNLRGNKPGLEATRLRKFLVGNKLGVTYDTTKVVEAIIRVRHFGSGIPVLRVDWDALLNERTLASGLLASLTSKIPRYCTHDLATDHRIHYYIISGLYEQPAGNGQNWNINDFNTAFATRMFPALVPTETALGALKDTVANGKDKANLEVDDLNQLAASGFFDRTVMAMYYGLTSHPEEPQSEGLRRLGSDPQAAVISGAGFVISEGAILDLPPFSNFERNVMWIDDYLKYELHRALGHFSEVTRLGVQANPQMPCREPNSRVYKDRILGGQGNVRPYTLGDYIPTLFSGILMDAWIRGEPPSAEHSSPFVTALQLALKRGIFDPSERNELRQALQEIAVKRINKLIELWSQLKTKDALSFAALWVGGDRSAIERVMAGLPQPDEEWLGWGLLSTGTHKINGLGDLREPIRKIVLQLVEEVCTYIDWTLEWPKFVQSVRAVKVGSLELDVSYVPDHPSVKRQSAAT